MSINLFNGKKAFSLLLTAVFLGLSIFTVNAEPVSKAADDDISETLGSSTAESRYSGAFVIVDDTKSVAQTYLSTKSHENALFVADGESVLTNSTIIKSGDLDEDSTDFHGTNAAVFVYNGATLNLSGGSVSTEGNRSDALFSYETGIINVNDMTISTIGDNSGGVAVAGGGTLNAKNATVSTTGDYSPALKSEKGGGTLKVDGGTYSTSGTGSPAIFSTAKISVSNANLTSTASEGVVVEDTNSVTLKNVTLTDTNNKLDDESDSYKNIFMYRSSSGNTKTVTSNFTAKDSRITTNKGDTFFVTNTTATIDLINNTIVNTDGDFLRVQSGEWGDEGSNGGNVMLNMSFQKAEGGIFVDGNSTLSVKMDDESFFKGFIDGDNQSKKVTLDLSKDSTVVLTSDSYIDLLKNEDTKNSNIYLNGHKLYVNGTAVSGNNGTYGGEATTATEATAAVEETTMSEPQSSQTDGNKITTLYPIIGISAAAFVVIVIAVVVIIKRRINIRSNNNETVGKNDKE